MTRSKKGEGISINVIVILILALLLLSILAYGFLSKTETKNDNLAVDNITYVAEARNMTKLGDSYYVFVCDVIDDKTIFEFCANDSDFNSCIDYNKTEFCDLGLKN